MQLMERVRELGADQAEVSEGTIGRARTALQRESAATAASRTPRRRRTLAGIGVGGLVAGTAVAAVVAGSVLAPAALPDAAAAEVLEQAAAVTVTAQDTRLADGQYLRIETVSEFLQFWDGAAADDGDENTFAFNASRDSGDAAVLVRDTRALYVPADRTRDWFYDWGQAEVVRSFGDRSEQAAQEWASSPGASIAERGTIQVLPGGVYPAGEGDAPPAPQLADEFRPFLEEMPRDPAKLRAWLAARSGMTGEEADRWVVAGLSDPSAVNLLPADLRAAFFRALALIPGFEVIDGEGDTAVLRYAVAGHRTTTLEIDTAEGLIESIIESYGSGGAAGDVPDSTTRVRMTVVDEAP